MKSEPTYLGLIRRVTGALVYAEISPDLPSASPIVEGHVYRLGQIGSFVRIPLGFLNLYGIVSMVGAAEARLPADEKFQFMPGQRWLEIQLVGEAYKGLAFQRGVSTYPTLDDEVHLITEADLALIYSNAGAAPVEIGTHAASENLRASVDIDRIVTRHAAIVGSTGSGKSNTVAGVLKALTSGAYPSARLLVIDPHGEYGPAFSGIARVFRIGDEKSPLVLPYWAMSFDELAWFFIDRRTGTESPQDAAFREKVFDMKRASVNKLKAGAVPESEITVDSPIPFDIRQLWYEFDTRERTTFKTNACLPGDEELEKPGDAKTLTPAKFTPAALGGGSPFKNKAAIGIMPQMNRLAARLRDKRFEFVCNPGNFDGENKDLSDLVASWLDHDQPITVLDLGGVPFEVVDLIVGIVGRMLFEVSFWGRDLPGIGRQGPVLLVLEEAHSYLPRGEARFIQGFGRRSIQRVFKEGRKYGLGCVVVSQRPSELDETILSQCGTFIALRLANPEDQGRVRALVPDALAGLIDLLPSLRTGEALVLGEAVPLPCRARLPLVEPRPKSSDPDVARQWKDERPKEIDYNAAVTAWRVQEPASLHHEDD